MYLLKKSPKLHLKDHVNHAKSNDSDDSADSTTGLFVSPCIVLHDRAILGLRYFNSTSASLTS